MWISRISRPGPLYDASASVQTSETIDETIVNPIDSGEVFDVNVASMIDMGYYSHIPGFRGCDRDFKRGRIALIRSRK